MASNDYRASVKKGSRKFGSSASAKHAYHQREGGYASGLEGAREDLAAFGSGNLPDWTGGNPALFWDATDSYERANGTLFKDLQLNLPAELTLEQNKQIIEAYAHRMFSAERLPYSWAMHVETNATDLNHHAHLMVSERMTDDIQRTAATHFKRHDRAKPEAGGALKTSTLKPKSWLMEARGAWAEAVNTGLVAAGYAPRFDHRSKEDQREAAFLRGDLRRVAELSTLTQVHEGPRIAGMRRRVEAGERTLASLPDYAQEIIQGNDAIREQNAAFLSLLESLDDSQVAELLAEELIERLHTEALALDAMFEAHTEALVLDAVFEAHTEALVLDAMFEAHTEALVLDAMFEAHRPAAKLKAALVSIDTLQNPPAPPPEVAVADGLRTAYDAAKANLDLAKETEKKAKQAAERWREENKIKSVFGLSRTVDAAAEAAKKARIDLEKAVEKSRNAYRDAPERQVAMAWEQSNKAAVAELESLQAQLPALQKVADEAQANAYPYEVLAVIEEQAEQLEQLNSAKIASDLLRQAKAAADAGDGRILVRLRGLGHEALERAEVQLIERGKALIDDARRDLRRASGLIENHLTWCPYDEREPLLALRRELERELDLLRQTLPAPAEALQLRESAAQRLGQVEGWRESQDAAKAERLRDRQQRPDADPAPEHDPSPSRQGPRLG